MRILVLGIAFVGHITGAIATPCPVQVLSVEGGGEVRTECVTHDQAVEAKINEYLRQGFSKTDGTKNGKMLVSARIQLALAEATAARVEGDSKDTVLRDAEYYLHGLYAMAAEDHKHALPVAGAPIYDALKWAAFELKGMGYDALEKWMRTDPDKPMSQPGGWEWAYKGLKGGAKIDGKKEVPPGPVPTDVSGRAPHGFRIVP